MAQHLCGIAGAATRNRLDFLLHSRNSMTMNKPEVTHLNGGLGVPPTEVELRPKRRRFTFEYERRILREADACTEPGQIGALLRREVLYSSALTRWRRQLQASPRCVPTGTRIAQWTRQGAAAAQAGNQAAKAAVGKSGDDHRGQKILRAIWGRRDRSG